MEVLGTGQGPYGINQTTWSNFTSEANATGVVSFSGPNVAMRYGELLPEQPDANDWSTSAQYQLSINVTAEVPLSFANDSFMDDDAYFTGTSISLNRTDDELSVDDSWAFCMYIYRLSEEALQNSTDDQSDCSGVLSDGCMAALQQSALNAGGDCSSVTIPDNCTDYFNENSSFAFTPSLENTTQVFAFGSDDFEHSNAEDANILDDIMPTYTQATDRIWPVVLLWGPDDFEPGFVLSHVSLHCLKASNFTENSVDPNEDQDNEDEQDSGDDQNDESDQQDDQSEGDDSGDNEDAASTLAPMGSLFIAVLVAAFVGF